MSTPDAAGNNLSLARAGVGDDARVPISRVVAAIRAAARSEAETALGKAGFVPCESERWEGRLQLPERLGAPRSVPRAACVQVHLPTRFPDELPEVFTAPDELPEFIPHRERNGKICIARAPNYLLDVSRPAALVMEALDRAANTIADGVAGANAADFAAEFLAYWEADAHSNLWSICSGRGQARALYVARVTGQSRPAGGTLLLADSSESAAVWAARGEYTISKAGTSAFFLPFAGVPTPSILESRLRAESWLDLAHTYCGEPAWKHFRHWLSQVRLPSVVLFAIPIQASPICSLAAAEIAATTGEARKRALRGFRPASLTALNELRVARNNPVRVRRIARLDPDFLLARGGAMTLQATTVVVIGCGAVGSHLAAHLAALGVGHLRLFDHETLRAENVHRHVLGVNAIGQPKVKALAEMLGRHSPHVQIEPVVSRVEDVLEQDPTAILEAGVVAIALGDETLERRLNQLLGATHPRVHAWLDPLGVGGHVLATGLPHGRGCYECLFEQTPTLRNRASFTAPGQDVTRSLAGCSGTFSPFSALDANRTALEAATLIGQVLAGRETTNVLWSWRGESDAFERAGLALSPRAQRLGAGQRVRDESFARIECPVCIAARVARSTVEPAPAA